MGKAWDHGVPGPEVWGLVLRALKPGGHLLAFGGTRTFHRLTCAIEDAGFEIRDCLSWLYGQGFPKSHNLAGAFKGYGTALKPAWEPVILAMKPTRGTFAENALAQGVAGLNVDGGRLGGTWKPHLATGLASEKFFTKGEARVIEKSPHDQGRWPANVLLDEEAAAMLDEQSGELGRSSGTEVPGEAHPNGIYGARDKQGRGQIGHGDSGGASRFFYTAKASRAEREAGLDGFDARASRAYRTGNVHSQHGGRVPDKIARNAHPTVKPLDLCRYLATLLLPPRRDTPRRLLVPFCGSGSEMIGGLLAGWDEVVGIEKEAEYVEIAEARIRAETAQIGLPL